VACDSQGHPISSSNLGASIGRRGLSAPGANITSLGVNGRSLMFGGTSAATPFVSGAIALLWSVFPQATIAQVHFSVIGSSHRRGILVPPVLDAWAAYQLLKTNLRM
jgi:subtilisin family serine protease